MNNGLIEQLCYVSAAISTIIIFMYAAYELIKDRREGKEVDMVCLMIAIASPLLGMFAFPILIIITIGLIIMGIPYFLLQLIPVKKDKQ